MKSKTPLTSFYRIGLVLSLTPLLGGCPQSGSSGLGSGIRSSSQDDGEYSRTRTTQIRPRYYPKTPTQMRQELRNDGYRIEDTPSAHSSNNESTSASSAMPRLSPPSSTRMVLPPTNGTTAGAKDTSLRDYLSKPKPFEPMPLTLPGDQPATAKPQTTVCKPTSTQPTPVTSVPKTGETTAKTLVQTQAAALPPPGIVKQANIPPKGYLNLSNDRYAKSMLNYMPESAKRFYDDPRHAIPSFNLGPDKKALQSCRSGVFDKLSNFTIPHKGRHYTYKGTRYEEKLGAALPSPENPKYIEGIGSFFAGPYDAYLATRDPENDFKFETGAIEPTKQLTLRGFKWEPLRNPKTNQVVKNRYGDTVMYASERTPDYFCAMRWDYLLKDAQGKRITKKLEFLRNKRILVHDPVKNTAVVCKPGDWGPNKRTGKVIDLSPDSLEALGYRMDQGGAPQLQISLAPDNMKLGPVEPQMNCASEMSMLLSGAKEGSSSPHALYYPPADAKRYLASNPNAAHTSILDMGSCPGGNTFFDPTAKFLLPVPSEPTGGQNSLSAAAPAKP